jgi:hypothetical protein
LNAVICEVYLVYLVCFVYFVGLVQPNKQDKPNKPNEQDRLTDIFSILLSITHSTRHCHDWVRTPFPSCQ